jgi:hypothetical protein
VLKSGTRLQSQVCDTQVIVVKASDELDDLCCGGAPMVPLDAEIDSAATLDPQFVTNSVMGKRYVDATGAEVLVTKAGVGTLTVASTPLVLKDAKPYLPATDAARSSRSVTSARLCGAVFGETPDHVWSHKLRNGVVVSHVDVR